MSKTKSTRGSKGDTLTAEVLRNNLMFINISKIKVNEDLFYWENNKNSSGSFKLNIAALKALSFSDDIYYHFNWHTVKICVSKHSDLLFIVGAGTELQFQTLEAVLEVVRDRFLDYYGGVLNSYTSVDKNIFSGFADEIDSIIKDIENMVVIGRAYCKICGKFLKIQIRKSFIEKSTKGDLESLVYTHEGHALLLYIDKHFKIRTVEIVNVTG